MTRPGRGEPPTGRQHRLRCGQDEVVVCEVGATIRHWRSQGHQVLMGFDEARVPTGGRGQVLAPWPNRVEDGRYQWKGTWHQLPIDEPDRMTAIHGLLRWSRFEVVQEREDSVRLGAWCPPRPAWPFSLWLEVTFSIQKGSLHVEADAENVGDAPLPFGIGFHPYFALGEDVARVRLRLPASHRLSLDDRGLPNGTTELEARWQNASEPIGTEVLDTCVGPLEHDDAGVATAELSGPDGILVLEVGSTFRWLQAFSADTLPKPDHRRAVAVEPMSCPPNALRTGTDLVHLDPGQRWNGWWRARYSPPTAPR
jgi:aldose 1-epimerase